jgi:phospholipid/cholesterol/gamma-HCH transport system permease protein
MLSTTIIPKVTQLGHFGHFSYQSIVRLLSGRANAHIVFSHIWTTVMRCMLPVLFTLFPVGVVIALQGNNIFTIYGAERLLPSLIAFTMFREITPVLAGALVAAQAGSANAAELGAMRIEEEIDATLVMGIDPIAEHVSPRVAGTVLATPLLSLFGVIAGVTGGLTVSIVQGQAPEQFLASLWEMTSLFDIFSCVTKGFVFGLIIALLSTYHGFHASNGPAGVGRAVNRTVVAAITTVITANFLLTSIMFGGSS